MSEKLELLRQAASDRDQQHYATAAEKYRQVLDRFGPDPVVYAALSFAEYFLYLWSDRSAEHHAQNALGAIRKALVLNPTRASYYAELGSMLENIGRIDYEGAAHAYRQALAIEPCCHAALAALTGLYEIPERVVPLDEAIQCCERAIQIQPTRSLWTVLARLYENAGRHEESAHALESSLLDLYEIEYKR